MHQQQTQSAYDQQFQPSSTRQQFFQSFNSPAQNYLQILDKLTDHNHSQHKSSLTSKLKNFGIIYNPDNYSKNVEIVLLESIDNGNILKLQVHYAYYTHIVTLYNTNQDSQIVSPSKGKGGVTRVKTKVMVGYKTKYAVRYLYQPQYFIEALKGIVKQYLLTKIGRVVLLKMKYFLFQTFSLIVYNNQILFMQIYQPQQLTTISKQQTNKLMDYMINLHMLHIVHNSITYTSLGLFKKYKIVGIFDFQHAEIYQQSNQFVQENQDKTAELNPYLQDFLDLSFATKNFKLPSPDDEARMQDYLPDFTELREQMEFKFFICFIFQNFLEFAAIVKQQANKMQHRSMLKNQLIDFTKVLGKRSQTFCNALLQYFEIKRSELQTAKSDHAKTFNYEYSCFLFQLQKGMNKHKNQFNSLIFSEKSRLSSKDIEQLYSQLSKYLVFTSNQFTIEERELKIGLIMETLQIRDYSLNFVLNALRATLKWTTQQPLSMTKVEIFQKIVLQCVIQEVQPQSELVLRTGRMMDLPGKTVLKLKLLMQVLNGAAWIQQKVTTTYNYIKLSTSTLALLDSQLQKTTTKQQLSAKTFILLKQASKYCQDKTQYLFQQLFKLVPIQPNTSKMDEIPYEERQLFLKVQEYIIGYLCMQAYEMNSIYAIQAYSSKILLSELHFHRISLKGYFQFEYYHFTLNKLLTAFESITDATTIFMSFTYLVNEVVDVKNYAIYLRYQVSNLLHYTTKETQKSAFDALILPMVVQGKIISQSFYTLLLKIGNTHPFLTKMLEIYAQQKALFQPSLSTVNIKLSQFDDLYIRRMRVQVYLDYYFYFALPLFSSKNQKQQAISFNKEDSALTAYISKIEQQISKVKNIGEKMKYYWLLNLQKITHTSPQLSDQTEHFNNIYSLLIYSMKDIQAFNYINTPLEGIFIKFKTLPAQQSRLVRTYLQQIMSQKFKFVELDFLYLAHLLSFYIYYYDAAQLADIIIEISEYMQRIKSGQHSVLRVCMVFGKEFATAKKTTKSEEWAMLISDIYEYLRLSRKTVLSIFYFLLLSNLAKGSAMLGCTCRQIAKNIGKASPKEREFIDKKYYKQYLKQQDLKLRKRRYVQKIDLKYDLKIQTTKKVLKKLLVSSKRKQNVMNKAGLFCSKLFECIDKYSQKLEILT